MAPRLAAKAKGKKKTPAGTKKPAKPRSAIKSGGVKKAVAATKRTVAPKKAPAAKTARVAKSEMPEILRDTALKVLDARKATDIVFLDVRGRNPIFDYMVVASGGSARQLGALAGYLREAFFKAGQRRVLIEGLEQGDWVLVDAGDVLVHLFRPEVRDYYRLEGLWRER